MDWRVETTSPQQLISVRLQKIWLFEGHIIYVVMLILYFKYSVRVLSLISSDMPFVWYLWCVEMRMTQNKMQYLLEFKEATTLWLKANPQLYHWWIKTVILPLKVTPYIPASTASLHCLRETSSPPHSPVSNDSPPLSPLYASFHFLHLFLWLLAPPCSLLQLLVPLPILQLWAPPCILL